MFTITVSSEQQRVLSFQKGLSKKRKTPVASLKCREWGLGVLIQIKMLLISISIGDYTILVLFRALYKALYCPAYSPVVAFLGVNMWVPGAPLWNWRL